MPTPMVNIKEEYTVSVTNVFLALSNLTLGVSIPVNRKPVICTHLWFWGGTNLSHSFVRWECGND